MKHGAIATKVDFIEAISANSPILMKQLLTHNQDLVKEKDLDATLCNAVFKKATPDTIALLLQLGASPSAEEIDKNGGEKMGVIAMALLNRNTEVAQLLVDAGGDVDAAKNHLSSFHNLQKAGLTFTKMLQDKVMKDEPFDKDDFDEFYNAHKEFLGSDFKESMDGAVSNAQYDVRHGNKELFLKESKEKIIALNELSSFIKNALVDLDTRNFSRDEEIHDEENRSGPII